MAVSGDKRRFQTTLPLATLNELRSYSRETGISVSAIIAIAVNDWLKRNQSTESVSSENAD